MMTDQFLLYISAATDLRAERETLGRAVTELPVTLGWRILQSSSRDEPVDLAAVARADLHLLLLGSDIRAPIGQEWLAARRAGRSTVLFLKQRILRTPAADDFVRYVREWDAWQPFTDAAQLRLKVLNLLADRLLSRVEHYALSPAEILGLQAWRAELAAPGPAVDESRRGGAGESGVILSPERYVPSEGILFEPDRGPED